MSEAATLPQPAQDGLEKFPVAFHDDVQYSGEIGVAWAPGRVNLIGEHTDYNDGYVLPIAIDRVTAFAGRRREDDIVRIWSRQFEDYAQFPLAGLPEIFEQLHAGLPAWAQYVLGVATELSKAGMPLSGFDAVVDGNVPLGGGMSSSAALEVATAEACAHFSGGRFTIGPEHATLRPLEVAALCQNAEHRASGLQSGILDQAASCLGRPEYAVFLDCRSLAYRYLPFRAPDLSLVVIDTGVRRELASSAYNERRQQCEEATRLLRDIMIQQGSEQDAVQRISTLRDITPEQFAQYGPELPELLRRRAGYVIAEDARVLRTVKLLESNEFVEIGKLLWQSHAGLRDDYEVSCFELDTLVEIARQVEGVLGGRMLGGGFGGCTINLVRNDALDVLRSAIEQQYPERTGRSATIDICRAAGGPGSAWIA